MLRALHLIDTYRIGGPGKTIINSARFIDRSRVEIHVGSFTNPARGHNEFSSAVQAAGIPYLELRETRRFNLSHVSELRDYMRRHAIDILHTHGYRTDALGYVAAFGTGTRIVTTHHGWITNNRRQELFKRLALNLCRLFDGVELVSERLRDELPGSFRRSPRVDVVRNALVLADYQPRGRRDAVRARLGIDQGQVLIGVIGRLSVEKGCLEMVDAFRDLARRHPSARLVFVGEGPIRSAIDAKLAEYGLQPLVRIVEHQREIQPFYEAIDIVASPSRTEGLSNVILESLAFERPIVATRVGGNTEILTDGVTGLLIEPRDPAAMAGALGRILDNPDLRDRLVRAGADRIRQAFSFEARMRAEEAFYDRAMAARRRFGIRHSLPRTAR
jgi:glycosyltransferase involved in cell wall biosynthesis